VGSKAKPADITPTTGADFLAKLREFPATRRPDIEKLPFLEAIAAWDGDRIAPKTVWKTFGHLKRVVAYAATMKLIPSDPLAVVKNPKPRATERVKDRTAYDPDEIKRLFSRPMFKGFGGKADWGYRDESGDQVVKDAKYWLPVFSLWHGCRLDEIASSRASELKDRDGIPYLDWTRRKLKTPESSRELPIHPVMKALGWVEYVADVRQRGDFLFPDLAHDIDDPEKAARAFSRWFGHWRTKNGFTDSALDFHSLRHTFKRACRDAGLSEEVHDLLTGHKGAGGVGRSYGQGADLKTLAGALAKVSYPTFPLATYKPPPKWGGPVVW
jgi:integrase